MLQEALICASYAVAVGIPAGMYARVDSLKSKQMDLNEDVKQTILEDGIYHITSKENAMSIVKNGFYLPTKGIINNHFSKSRTQDKFADLVYMFAGKPSLYSFGKNIVGKMSKDGTVYAVRHHPDEFDLENYTQRLEDGAITYEGRLDVAHNNPEVVRLKFEKNKIVEVPIDEKLPELPIHKRVLYTSLETGLGVVASIGEIAKDLVYRDKNHQIRNIMSRRRIENKALEQFNEEKSRRSYTYIKDGKNYVVAEQDDKTVDGKKVVEFAVLERKGEEFLPVKRVYSERTDTGLTETQMENFFETTIHLDKNVDEYVGKPEIQNESIVQVLDERYSEHFKRKQEAAALVEANYNRFQDAKSRRQMEWLNSIYSQVPAPARTMAQRVISNIKELGKNAIRQNTEEKGIIDDTKDR